MKNSARSHGPIFKQPSSPGCVQRGIFFSLAMGCVLLAVSIFGTGRASAQMGYNGADLERMGQWLQYNQLELYRLEIPNYASPYAVALTSGKHGWRIAVFLRDGGVTNVDWDSGFLGRPFQVASTDNLVLVPQVGKNFGVTFTGCKLGECASVYGALLYLPWSHRLFEKRIAGSAVACSQSLLDPGSAVALRALDDALRRQRSTVKNYNPPPCPGAGQAMKHGTQ